MTPTAKYLNVVISRKSGIEDPVFSGDQFLCKGVGFFNGQVNNGEGIDQYTSQRAG